LTILIYGIIAAFNLSLYNFLLNACSLIIFNQNKVPSHCLQGHWHLFCDVL